MSEINNWDAHSILNGTDDADVLGNISSGSTIMAGGGNDSITNYSESSDTTIFTGAGNDTVDQWNGTTLNVIAGAGSTLVRLFENNTLNVTLESGGSARIDRTYGVNSDITYHFSDGNATLENYSGGEIIRLENRVLDGVSTDGNDLILRAGDNRLTLKNMRGRAITISDLLGTSTQIYAPNNRTPVETMQRFVEYLDDTSKTDAESALKSAVRECSGFYDMQDAIDCFIADCRNINDAERFLVEKCGIILDNNDTGALTGWDAGGLNVKTDANIIPADGDADYPSSTFTRHRFTFTVPSRHSLNNQERLVVQAFYSWWADSIIDLIEDSYGLKFSSSDLNFNSVPISFFYDENDAAAAYGGHEIEINMAGVSFDESDRTGGGLDKTLAHEMTHVIQQAAFNNDLANDLPHFFEEGMADLTAGRDNWTLREIADDPSTLGYYLTFDYDPSYTNDLYSAGYMFMRYLTWHGSEESGATDENLFDDGSGGNANDVINRDGQNLKYGANMTFDRNVDRYIGIGEAALSVDDDENVAVWLNGWDGKTYDNIKNLDGSSARSEAILAGNDQSNEIRGGSGTNLMWGGDLGDDTLIGGAGGTTYFYLYTNGADVIENARDDDVINLLNIGLEEINFADIHMDSDSIKIGMNDGGSIKVNGAADVIFQLNNGVGFRAERATGGWRLR